MRDHYYQMKALGAEVFGLSTQTSEYQREMVNRLHLPFEVLSDSGLAFTNSLRLPIFSFAGIPLIRRLTLVVMDKKIEKVFYPIFPPDQHGPQVVAWLKSKQPA
jgi:peroxiredoxin